MENLNYILHILHPIFSKVFEVSPKVNFLSDVAAFEAVIVALSIPLSFEIVSRISERYQSDVISRKFEAETINKRLPYILVVNIVAAIGLRFHEGENPQGTLWKIMAWIIFAGFLFTAYSLLRFIRRLKLYMSRTDVVIDKLFDDAEKSIQEK